MIASDARDAGMINPVIALDHVCKTFNDQLVVNDLTFSVRRARW